MAAFERQRWNKFKRQPDGGFKDLPLLFPEKLQNKNLVGIEVQVEPARVPGCTVEVRTNWSGQLPCEVSTQDSQRVTESFDCFHTNRCALAEQAGERVFEFS